MAKVTLESGDILVARVSGELSADFVFAGTIPPSCGATTSGGHSPPARRRPRGCATCTSKACHCAALFEETSLGLRTVRTIVDQGDGCDRTTMSRPHHHQAP